MKGLPTRTLYKQRLTLQAALMCAQVLVLDVQLGIQVQDKRVLKIQYDVYCQSCKKPAPASKLLYGLS